MSGVGVISGRVAVFCFSSAGELDVVLPLLTLNGIDDFAVAVFRQEILDKIRADSFYGALLAGRLEDHTMTVPRRKLARWRAFITSSVRALRRYGHYDQYCFEYGHAGREKNILLALLALAGRGSRVRFYPHGHAVTADSAYDRARWPRTTAMCLRRGARILKLGEAPATPPVIPVGYPILAPAWRKLVAARVPQLYSGHLVILSRDVHRDYLLEENRQQMLEDTVVTFERCFPGAPIVLKAHPREVFAAKHLKIADRTVEVSYENTYAVVRGAHLAVSFWTSAFFQCMALDVPVVEYHLAHERFRQLYPHGSLNAQFVPRFEDAQSLLAYVARLAAAAPRSTA